MSIIKKHISLLLSVCLLLCAALLGACAAGVNTKPVYDADGRLLEPESYGRVKLGQYKGLDVTETIVTASETALQISMEYERENFPDMSEYCREKISSERLKGMIMAPWIRTIPEYRRLHWQAADLMAEAIGRVSR